MSEISRPDLVYVDKTHSYFLNGQKLDGVSTVAKIGDTDVWGVAAAWAFRIGYEGVHDILNEPGAPDVDEITKDELREYLKQARKTPWHKTDDAKERGNAIHTALETLARKNQIPKLEDFPEAYRGFVRALCKWYLDYRPQFVATEVQVVSETHMFAGRYDLLCLLTSVPASDERATVAKAIGLEPGKHPLCLVDLKTGKRPYPTSQFPQLAGYELASVEMGYTPTDAQFVLNVHDDGTYEFERSVATAEHFLAYLAAQRAIKDLQAKTKKPKKETK